MEPMTRAQMRDHIRRRLGKVPAIDAGMGVEGEAIQSQPVPTNSHIDAAVDEALAEINRFINAETTSSDLSASVDAQTADGPYRVNLLDILHGQPNVSIQQVRAVYWNDGSTVQKLDAQHVSEMDRDHDDWQNQSPGTPTKFWVEGFTLNLYPAPSSAGTLQLRCGTDLKMLGGEGGFASSLPSDYHPIICDIAAATIAAAVPDDEEMKARLALLVPRAEAGKAELLRWRANVSESYRPHVEVFSYRRGRR